MILNNLERSSLGIGIIVPIQRIRMLPPLLNLPPLAPLLPLLYRCYECLLQFQHQILNTIKWYWADGSDYRFCSDFPAGYLIATNEERDGLLEMTDMVKEEVWESFREVLAANKRSNFRMFQNLEITLRQNVDLSLIVYSMGQQHFARFIHKIHEHLNPSTPRETKFIPYKILVKNACTILASRHNKSYTVFFQEYQIHIGNLYLLFGLDFERYFSQTNSNKIFIHFCEQSGMQSYDRYMSAPIPVGLSTKLSDGSLYTKHKSPDGGLYTLQLRRDIQRSQVCIRALK